MRGIGKKFVQLCSFFVGVILLGCTTAPVDSSKTVDHLMAENHTFGKNLAKEVESQIKVIHIPEIDQYLKELGEELAAKTLEMKGAHFQIQVVKDRDAKWHSFSIPGNHVYLSEGLLKKLDYENEIASLVAVKLVHAFRNLTLRRAFELLSQRPQNDPDDLLDQLQFFGTEGIFHYSDEIDIKAYRAAVRILYETGYDARGLVSLLEIFKNNPEFSPFDPLILEKLEEEVRIEIALFPPLRNPIIRTNKFVLFQKRIRQT